MCNRMDGKARGQEGRPGRSHEMCSESKKKTWMTKENPRFASGQDVITVFAFPVFARNRRVVDCGILSLSLSLFHSLTHTQSA